MNDEPILVSYEAYMYATRIPKRYIVHLYVSDIPTGIMAKVWGKKRARQTMHSMIEHGNELLNEYGVAATVAAEIYAKRREEAMAKVKVGDKVKLLVDIGQFKKGRVCRVVEVAEPSFYEARGGTEWHDDRYPIKVMPVQVATDKVSLGPKDFIPLANGEFGPVNEETDD